MTTDRVRESEPRKLAELMPPLSTEWDTGVLPTALFWTSEELAAGRRRQIERYIRAGWKFGDDGLLSKAGIERRPGYDMGAPIPGDPRKDATALRLGATFLRPGRYRLGDWLLDDNGCIVHDFNDSKGCEMCGESIYMKIPARGRETVRVWDYDLTYCPCCISSEEIAAMRQAVPTRGRQRRRR